MARLPAAGVNTLAATVTNASATLNGTVNAEGQATVAYFRWGTNVNYGTSTVSTNVGSSFTNVSFSINLTGLASGTYHFQAAATNSGGTNFGPDMTFTIALGSPTVTTLAATLSCVKVGATENAPVNEAISTSAATTGNQFRYTGGQYLFNWSTKGLAAGTSLALHGNIFMAERVGQPGKSRMGIPPDQLQDCANNVMVWLGPGSFPATLPSCFTVTTDRSVWDDAVADWLARHPTVAP